MARGIPQHTQGHPNGFHRFPLIGHGGQLVIQPKDEWRHLQETSHAAAGHGRGQRGFQLAGVRSVVASLWQVPDEETHQLMREFYRRVWSDKHVSKAEALRQAQLWMLKNWKPRGLDIENARGSPPPYVWAAFVLSGDWR